MIYRREGKKRKLSKHRMLILCEGKTERFYLQGLKKTLPRQVQRNIDLDIITAKESEPEKALIELNNKIKKAKREKYAYTDKYLVFDDDNRNLTKVFKELAKNNINYVYNSISIEFWFLLHYKNTTKQYTNANEVIKELEKDFGTYSKTDPEFWNKLSSRYNKAKNKAKNIRKQHSDNGTLIQNSKPFSNMDELVDKINELQNNYKLRMKIG